MKNIFSPYDIAVNASPCAIKYNSMTINYLILLLFKMCDTSL